MEQKLDLQINGRLFPSWVMMNFKKFTLPKVMRKDGEDPCNEVFKKELTLYQRFVSQFVSYNSPFKDILIYHGLGAGKTVSAINIYNVLFNYTPKWNVFLLIKASLKNDPWLKDLKNWLNNSEQMMQNIYFVSYDAPNADEQFLNAFKKVDASKNNLFIFDEAHNFIRNVYSNKTTKKGKRAQVIYDTIIQEKKETGNARVILLSATPAINQPYEIGLLFNLLRPNTFPDNEAEFNQTYISSTGFRSINEETKNMFQRRILGLTSYYIGATPDKFADKIVHYRELVMSPYFEKVYQYFEEIEEKREMNKLKFRGRVSEDEMATYKTYTRQSSNFVFPNINNKIYGEKRPRPGDYKIFDKDETKILEGKQSQEIQQLRKDKKELIEYDNAVKLFIHSFKQHCLKLHENDKKNKHTIQDDINNFLQKYKTKINLFINDTKKSSLFNELYTCSPKMIMIILYLLKSKGPVLVYSNYVKMEGLQIFRIYCKFIGFINIFDDIKLSNKKKDYFRYMEYHGGIDPDVREKNKIIFNNKNNKYGKDIKIIMISPAGTEGINLENVRQVHIMEPYWNEVRIEQIIGRAIRQCSHKHLPMDERKVDVYRYKMIRKNKKETTDQLMEDIARRKNNLIQSFLEAVRESAVDCQLFKNHNMMGLEYQCFNFNQESLLDKPIGPAFKYDPLFDSKINNGSNSTEAITKRIKVKKINVVKKLDDNNISDVLSVWYDPDTHFIYDTELHYPLGKIKIDDNNKPVKIEENVFLVDKSISIPTFTFFE